MPRVLSVLALLLACLAVNFSGYAAAATGGTGGGNAKTSNAYYALYCSNKDAVSITRGNPDLMGCGSPGNIPIFDKQVSSASANPSSKHSDTIILAVCSTGNPKKPSSNFISCSGGSNASLAVTKTFASGSSSGSGGGGGGSGGGSTSGSGTPAATGGSSSTTTQSSNPCDAKGTCSDCGGGSDGSSNSTGDPSRLCIKCTNGNCADPAAVSSADCSKDGCDFVHKYINPGINLLTIVFGLIAVISILLGSLNFITSEGDPQKASRAKTRIVNTVFAIFAYAFMYAFLQFLVPGGIFNN